MPPRWGWHPEETPGYKHGAPLELRRSRKEKWLNRPGETVLLFTHHAQHKLMTDAVPAPKPARLLSLDALRGFDMFWIVGGEEIVHALHQLRPHPVIDFFAYQLTHKPWEGLAFYDLIFPLFVFIVGISIVFSVSRMVAEQGKAAAFQRILRRAVILYLLGIFYYGGFSEGVDRIRLLGVLQRIAICYFFAATLFCFLPRRALLIACLVLLGGYWALMEFVPVPGVGAGHFEERQNLANYIDRQYLPLRKWDGDHDPEGLLSTLPAIATSLLGVFAGLLLTNPRFTPQQKVVWLLAYGLAGIILGFGWGYEFPVIKKLWTSSYVLVAAGYSCLFLALFYQIIDIWGWRRWCQPFVWIGLNPLTIYVAHNIIDFPQLAERLAGGEVKASFGVYGQLVIACVVVALTFFVVYFLYRKKIFFRL